MKTDKNETCTTIYTLRLPSSLHEKIVQRAKSLNIGIAAYLRMELTKLLNKEN